MRCLRTLFHEETALLSVRKFPFRVRTPEAIFHSTDAFGYTEAIFAMVAKRLDDTGMLVALAVALAGLVRFRLRLGKRAR